MITNSKKYVKQNTELLRMIRSNASNHETFTFSSEGDRVLIENGAVFQADGGFHTVNFLSANVLEYKFFEKIQDYDFAETIVIDTRTYFGRQIVKFLVNKCAFLDLNFCEYATFRAKSDLLNGW